jgi:UDP-N-acetylmuramoyl-L-alanyl-D-glutamate--2,6-diaminopimelate ligase
MTSEGEESDVAREAKPAEGLGLLEIARELPGDVDLHAPAGADTAAIRITGVQHDSRRVEPDDLYVVRRGASFDGRAFLADVVAKGARAVLAARDLDLPELPVPILRVDDVAEGLAYAAAAVYGHPAFSLDIVGVTGTNGKTTTTHLVRAAIDGAAGRPACGVVGTVGHSYAGRTVAASHTTPEADELARVLAVMRRRGASHVAMEVSSIALVLGRASAVRFRVAAFTNLTQDHLDFHGTMEAYAEAKMRLFTSVGPGLAVVNTSDPFGVRIAEAARCKVLRVRTEAGASGATGADVFAERVDESAAGMRILARTPTGRAEITTRFVGRHNVENLLVALGVASALELDVEKAAAGLSVERGAPGRLERCDGPGDDVVVLVDYAHTPDALARVLDAVRPAASTSGRVICVFGCGGDRDATKRGPMGEAAASRADVVVVTSDNPRTEDPAVIAAPIESAVRAAGLPPLDAEHLEGAERGHVVELDRANAIELAVRGARPGDVVLIAGKGHEDYQIVGTEKRAFDDRAVARAALARRRVHAGAP